VSDEKAILRTGLDQLERLIRSIGPDDLDRPTPCAEWDVRDLVAHVVQGTGRFATMVRGGEVDWTEPTPPVGEDAAGEFRARAEELLDAWDATEVTEQNTPAWQLAEIAVHTYDLARALDTDTAQLDPEVADTGRGFMEANLTDDRRGEVFGPAQDAPVDADAYERIAAFAGRAVAAS
jgi:uncharacterized protein (TIGR03086 family)